MDLRQIKYFISLYEEGSVTRAARRLNVVQPALSMQLSRMEEDLGQKLFERGSRGMVPTAAGRAMYSLYLPIVRDLLTARQQMDMLAGQITGPLAVGVIVSMTQRMLLPTIEAFINKYPQVKLSVSEGYTATLIEWVSSGQLDFGIVNRPIEKLTVLTELIFTDDFVLATGARSSVRLPGTIAFKALTKLKLVVPSRRHSLRSILDQHAQVAGVVLQPELELDSINGITDLVAKSEYCTVLTRTTLANHIESGVLRAHAIRSPRPTRDLIYIHHPRRPLSAAASVLMSLLTADLTMAQTRDEA
jgi:DNA-binding transcriptional LysR family regulator